MKFTSVLPSLSLKQRGSGGVRLSQSWIEIDASALRNNLNSFRKLVHPHLVIPVIKSNAYGHGMELIAELLRDEGDVSMFGVASLSEALYLRSVGHHHRLLVLSFFRDCSEAEILSAIHQKIEFPLTSFEDARILERIASSERIRVHLKVDTGTTRLGLSPTDASKLLHQIQTSPSFQLCGIYTHFAESESDDQTFTVEQIERFDAFLKSQRLGNDVLVHSACTAAMLRQPLSHPTATRLGIGLYGLWPSPATKHFASGSLTLKPALSWKTQILQIKKVAKGTSIGYDRTYITPNPAKIAIIPVGYWDGLDRGYSNCGEVLINGQRCPIRGRVCMNLSMVEVTRLPNVKPGDEVVLIGQQGIAELSADEMALRLGTISYETVTRLNPLIPRIPVHES